MCYSLPEFIHSKFTIKDNREHKKKVLSALLSRKKSYFIANFRQALRELSDDFESSIADNLSDKSTADFVLAVGNMNMFYCYPSKDIEYKVKGLNVFLDNRAIGMLATKIVIRNIMWSSGYSTVDYYSEFHTGLKMMVHEPLKEVMSNMQNHDIKTVLDCTGLLYFFERYLK